MHRVALVGAVAGLLLTLGCGGGGSAGDAGDAAERPAAGGTPSTPVGPVTPTTPATTVAPVVTPSITVPPALRDPGRDRPVLGGDVSWPQCPKGTGIPQKQGQGAPMPLGSAAYVVLGLTNGPSFTPNPCLSAQVAYVRQRRLLAAAYAVHSFPDAATLARYGARGPYDARTTAGRLANTGYAQARFNLATMRSAGLTSPVVWVDVEPVPDFEWSPSTVANAAVVRGAVRSYADAGYGVGVYSTRALWAGVVGDLRLGLPEWRAAGHTSAAEALRRCGTGSMVQGGTAVLAQWVEDGRDRDVTCPGTSVHLRVWFHRY